jgi:hypothetical protein
MNEWGKKQMIWLHADLRVICIYKLRFTDIGKDKESETRKEISLFVKPERWSCTLGGRLQMGWWYKETNGAEWRKGKRRK